MPLEEVSTFRCAATASCPRARNCPLPWAMVRSHKVGLVVPEMRGVQVRPLVEERFFVWTGFVHCDSGKSVFHQRVRLSGRGPDKPISTLKTQFNHG